MKLKGKQLKRVRRYRSADPFKRLGARLRHAIRILKVPALCGKWGYIDVNKSCSSQALKNENT